MVDGGGGLWAGERASARSRTPARGYNKNGQVVEREMWLA